MATVAAATLKSPELFSTFFAPYTDPKTGVIVIGISPAEPGVQDASKGSELYATPRAPTRGSRMDFSPAPH